MRWTLAQLAHKFGLEVAGDGDAVVDGVCALAPGRAGALAFLADPRYAEQLVHTAATAVLLRARDRAGFAGPALVAADPAVAFARIAALFDTAREFPAGVHAAAVVAPGARLGAGVGIGPCAVIEDDVEIGEGTWIGPCCVVRRGARIGANARLEANVYVGQRCEIGSRTALRAGAVIGERGFGLAPSPQGWIESPQLGRVVIGDDVEIGANSCIDRGALDDTAIENGVKIDNMVQIAHNCRIGAHTAIAACVGIAGSTTIGSRCMIAGACGIGGHLNITDNVVILGFTMVTKSLTKPGAYGSGLPVAPVRDWRKQVARVHRLKHFEDRLKRIEAALQLESAGSNEEGEQDG
jgi:UDP-3-O-[3-hydroxymyristoyl] glucosamine N-acyltransferase